MMVSTKGRYGLRVMLDLAQYSRGEFVSLKVISERQGISLKYLEAIIGALTQQKLVESQRGKVGGYRLLRPLDGYTVAEILQCVEGDLAPVSCLGNQREQCPRRDGCQTLPLWMALQRHTELFLEGITLQDMIDETYPME